MIILDVGTDIIFVDWIVKKEKSTGTLRHLSHALDPLGVWGMTSIVLLFAPSFPPNPSSHKGTGPS